MSEKPLLFISHRHENDKVGGVLYDFLRERALGKVEIFCSSRAEAAPAPGSSLSSALREKLADARALALIYTTDDADWSYCMYECGLATDPLTPTTRIVVFQCTDDVPKVYADVVRVNIHDQQSVKAFVIQLLTHPDFFPGSDEALAPGFNDDSPEVAKIAEDLGSKLREAGPPPKSAPDDEWPSFDSLTLELDLDNVGKVHAEDSTEEEASNLILDAVRVVNADKFCPQLFGMPNIPKGTPLREIAKQWRSNNSGCGDLWIGELVRQIREASAWRFPRIRWVTMKARDRQDTYIPGVHYVRKIQATGCVQFAVYFLPVLRQPEESGGSDNREDT